MQTFKLQSGRSIKDKDGKYCGDIRRNSEIEINIPTHICNKWYAEVNSNMSKYMIDIDESFECGIIGIGHLKKLLERYEDNLYKK